MIKDRYSAKTKRLVVSGSLARAGANSPAGVTRPWASLPTSSNLGAVVASDALPALAPGHPWLRMIGSLPSGVPDNYNGANTAVTDGTLTAWLLNPRQWGRRGKLLKRPRCLLIGGIPINDEFRNEIISLVAPFTAAGIDVIEISSTATNHLLCPLLGPVPVESSSNVSIGSILTGPGNQPAVAYRSVTTRAAIDFDGSQLYVANLGASRMAFGQLSEFTVLPSAVPSGVVGALSFGSFHSGYTFKVTTEWTPGNDPGPQAFTGCTEVGSTEVPGLGGAPSEAARIQVFPNGARAAEDRANLLAHQSRFEKLKVVFFGNEAVASTGGFGYPTAPADLNPGSPGTVAASIDGGAGVTSYVAFSGNPLTSTAAAEAAAAAVLADASSFFGL